MVLTNIANFVFGPEIIILVIVIGVLIFGVKKIPELAKTFGKAKGEFEKGKIEAEKELKDFKDLKYLKALYGNYKLLQDFKDFSTCRALYKLMERVRGISGNSGKVFGTI